MTIRSPFYALLSMALVVPGTLAGERGRPAGPRTEGRLHASFRKLDRDGDGRLSFSEWHRTRRGAEAMPSKALGLFRTSDLNRNQRLSPYEFGRSQGIRISLPNLHSSPVVRGEGSRGATFTTGSGRGSNTTSGLLNGSSLTKGTGSTGASFQFGIPGGSGTGSVNKLGAGAVFISGSANTLTPSSGGTTLTRPNPQTQPTGSGTTNSSGDTLPGSGSLTLTGGSTTFIRPNSQTLLTVSGTVSHLSSADTLTLSSGNLTIGTLNPLALLTAPGTTDSSGNTILNAGPLSLSGGGTFHVGMLPVGTIQGGNLVISGTFSRYVGLTLEAATALADSESRASRVVSIDGVRQVVTADWSPTRVNFFLVDGIVKLAIGG